MAKEHVETIYGKYNKFEILKDGGGAFGSIKFYLYKDGKPYKGPYSSLNNAVDAAKNEN